MGAARGTKPAAYYRGGKGFCGTAVLLRVKKAPEVNHLKSLNNYNYLAIKIASIAACTTSLFGVFSLGGAHDAREVESSYLWVSQVNLDFTFIYLKTIDYSNITR